MFTHICWKGEKEYRDLRKERLIDAPEKWDMHKCEKVRDEGSQCSGKDMRPGFKECAGKK